MSLEQQDLQDFAARIESLNDIEPRENSAREPAKASQSGENSAGNAISNTYSDNSALAETVKQIITPIVNAIGEMLQRNAEAMEQIAASQRMTSERIAALEKRVRLQTPINSAQLKYINDAIRQRARDLLQNRGIEVDTKAINKLSALIRKTILVRYGIGNLREVPAYDYETAIKQAESYMDLMILRDVVREARTRQALNAEDKQSEGKIECQTNN